jgi:hypothetical protein
MGVGGQRHALAALPPGMTRYPLYRRLGRPQGWSGRVLKILTPLGFDPRTVQLVASRYTNYAIPAHDTININTICYFTLYSPCILSLSNSFIFTNTCTTIMSYSLHPYICFDYLLVVIRGIKVYTIIMDV